MWSCHIWKQCIMEYLLICINYEFASLLFAFVIFSRSLSFPAAIFYNFPAPASAFFSSDELLWLLLGLMTQKYRKVCICHFDKTLIKNTIYCKEIKAHVLYCIYAVNTSCDIYREKWQYKLTLRWIVIIWHWCVILYLD